MNCSQFEPAEMNCLNFNKAQIIYFLTFTKLLGDTPKHQSMQWVVDNYIRYAPLLP